MNDRDALFSAILAHPDEDTPRLAFADYVEEQGEGDYAAFIRKQIELAKVEQWDELWVRTKYLDPDTIKGENRPLPEPPPPLWWNWSAERGLFQRGFPSAISVPDAKPFRDAFAAIIRLAPVDRVQWYGTGDQALPHWSGLINDPLLARVRGLTLSLVRLNAGGIQELHDSPHAAALSELHLITCDMPLDQITALLRLPRFRRLMRLSLSIPEDNTGAILEAAAEFDHQLRSLHLSCGPSRRSSALLSELFFTPLFRELKGLDLTEQGMNRTDAEKFCRSPAVDGLESLRLWFCYGGDELAIALAGCAALTSLRQLELYSNGITARGVQTLAESPYLANLRVLELSANPIGDEGAMALARSPHLNQLLDLQLLGCEIGDDGGRAFLDSSLAESLVNLELRHADSYGSLKECPISEPVAQRLRERFGNRLRLDPPTADDAPPLA